MLKTFAFIVLFCYYGLERERFMQYLYYILLALASYMIGNISGARIVARLKHGDITKSGSGNPGTLNTWRTFGFWPGILTFVLDMLKGVIPTLFAVLTFNHFGCNAEIALFVAGFCVVLGHIYPVVFKFNGGKGVATTIGVFFVANWWVTLIAVVVMLIGILFVKYASIFTIGIVIVLSIVEICLCNPANWLNYIFIAGILLLVLIAHRANIKRIFTGKENKTELLKMLKGLGKKKENKEEDQKQENVSEIKTDKFENNDE